MTGLLVIAILPLKGLIRQVVGPILVVGTTALFIPTQNELGELPPVLLEKTLQFVVYASPLKWARSKANILLGPKMKKRKSNWRELR